MEQKTFLLHTNYEIFFHLTFLTLKYDPTILQHFQMVQRMGFKWKIQMNLCNGLFVYVYIIAIVQKNNLKKQNLILLPSSMFSMKFSLHLDGFRTLHNEHKLLIFVASSMKPVAFLSPFFISCTSSMQRLLKRIFCM